MVWSWLWCVIWSWFWVIWSWFWWMIWRWFRQLGGGGLSCRRCFHFCRLVILVPILQIVQRVVRTSGECVVVGHGSFLPRA